jgi:L-histidine N-alpha-methyltransferase
VSSKDQEVFIETIDRSIRFRQWEAIHTESAYKYNETELEKMAAESGFIIRKNLYDSRSYFIDSLWQVVKDA